MSFIVMPFAIIPNGRGRMCRKKTVTEPGDVSFKLAQNFAYHRAIVPQSR